MTQDNLRKRASELNKLAREIRRLDERSINLAERRRVADPGSEAYFGLQSQIEEIERRRGYLTRKRDQLRSVAT